MRSTLFVLALAVIVPAPRIADACSPPACWGGAFVPGDRGQVPANVPGLYWRPMKSFGTDGDPKNVLLTSAAAPTTPIPFTAQSLPNGDFLLVPNAPLAQGSYILADHTVCADPDGGLRVTFSVGPAAAMPSDLGVLGGPAPSVMKMDIANSGGSCSSEVTVAQASIDLTLSATAMPWIDALHFETLVDGKPWHYQTSSVVLEAPGASATGRGRDRLFEVCEPIDPAVPMDKGLEAGKHVVTMRATLPGSTFAAMSSSLDVELACAKGSDPVEPGPSSGGCSAVGRGAASWPILALLALIALRGSARSARRGTV